MPGETGDAMVTEDENLGELIDQIRNEFSLSECEGELVDAARYDDLDVIRALLRVHPALHQCQDQHGNTALHMSAANGHYAVTEYLLQQPNATVNVTNAKGNSPLHWASTNGHDRIVQLLLKHQNVDVLQQNQFGRSALTEGFTSQNMDVVKSLLGHESASEERLVQPSNNNHDTSSSSQNNNNDDVGGGGDSKNSGTAPNSVEHDLMFGTGVEIKARELAMAESDNDVILGQVNPSEDTTGLGIWPSSLVLAQWLTSSSQKIIGVVSNNDQENSNRPRVVVELGAGCGVPSLALAQALNRSSSSSSRKDEENPNSDSTSSSSYQIIATDFSPKTVENLQYNIDLNKHHWKGSGDDITVKAMHMNWQDPNTWPITGGETTRVDCLIGSDLMYQSDMVPVLLETIQGLLKPGGCFWYVARTDGQRQGHAAFLAGMEAAQFTVKEQVAPPEYAQQFNPLQSQDDDLCYLYFNELHTTQYTLYEFQKPLH